MTRGPGAVHQIEGLALVRSPLHQTDGPGDSLRDVRSRRMAPATSPQPSRSDGLVDGVLGRCAVQTAADRRTDRAGTGDGHPGVVGDPAGADDAVDQDGERTAPGCHAHACDPHRRQRLRRRGVIVALLLGFAGCVVLRRGAVLIQGQ